MSGSAPTSALPTTTPLSKPIPVLLLKTKSTPTDTYETYFSSSTHYAPQFVPVLSHTFHTANLQTLRRLLTDGNDGASLRAADNTRYGGLIFTSQRAVEAFDRVVREVAAENQPQLATLALPLYVVGPATSRALSALTASHLPACSVLGAETGNGESLAAFILQHYNALPRPDGAEGRKPALLFLVGEQRRDVIPRTLASATLPEAQRVEVEEMVVYESGLLRSFEEDLVGVLGRMEDGAEGDAEAEAEEVGWVVVFSPTGCRELLGVLGVGNQGKERWKRKMFVATIGPTTRDYLVREFGFEPDVCAERPSPEGVGEGIRRFMEGKGLAVG